MAMPKTQSAIYKAASCAHAASGVRWGPLAVFCGLLSLWTFSLARGVTLRGGVHLALIFAVWRLISSIQSKGRSEPTFDAQ
jgi:hypothetical protein